MPPLSAYTPFESLLLFQSLATLHARPASFVTVSDTLCNNPFVRQDAAFDVERLKPEALEDLYTTLMRDGIESDAEKAPSTVARNGVSNPKKRKISSPHADGLEDPGSHAVTVPELVCRLYAKYKELVTKEIRKDEKRYQEIRDEIALLLKEDREAAGSVQTEGAPPKTDLQAVMVAEKPQALPEQMDIEVVRSTPILSPAKEEYKSGPEAIAAAAGQRPGDQQATESSRQSPLVPLTPVALPSTQRHPETGPSLANFERSKISRVTSQLPQPAPQQQTTGRQIGPLPSKSPAQQRTVAAVEPDSIIRPSSFVSPQPIATSPPTLAWTVGEIETQPVPLPQSHLPSQVSTTTPTQPAASANKAAARLLQEVSAPARALQQLPEGKNFYQRSANEAVQTPAVATPFRGRVGELKQTATGYPATPQQAPQPERDLSFRGIPPTTPLSIIQTVEPPISINLDSKTHRPEVKRPPRPSISTPGSATPWKTSPRISIPVPPKSPVRPAPEDVSPISERGSPAKELSEAAPEPVVKRRRGRPPGKKTQRAQLLAAGGLDNTAKAQIGKGGPSTRRRRAESTTTSSPSRGQSVASQVDESLIRASRIAQNKIKLETPDETEPVSRAATSTVTPEVQASNRTKRKRAGSELPERELMPVELEPSRPGIAGQNVLCARNFGRTTSPIMNEVTMHKLASIFAKPLTERDAPGYRDLIYRPQDLKSIKSAIHYGNRAVVAATEAANTPGADGDSLATNVAGASSKSGLLVLQKTEDVIPPKGIVNSAQLEKELVRMFANAIMFNPIPQRGFGPAFPMVHENGSRESTELEGGIIKDTLEMFEDVEKAVTRWRAAERTGDELKVGSKGLVSRGRGSAGDINTDSMDEAKG